MLLEVADLTTAYEGLVAVQGVSIEVAAGEIVAVAGANGAGKSTLLKTIAGSERPRSGSVTFDGRRIDGTWRRTKTAGPLTFTDAHGTPIALRPGQTWVTLQG